MTQEYQHVATDNCENTNDDVPPFELEDTHVRSDDFALRRPCHRRWPMSTGSGPVLGLGLLFALGLGLGVLVRDGLLVPRAAGGGAAPPRSPNFVLVLTDDLDLTIGGGNASTLARTRHLLGGEGPGGRGRTFDDWFAQTPLCCPSRAELLTGRTYHRVRVRKAAARGCMHVAVDDDPGHPFWDRHFFARHFAARNYSVGLFGKLLNVLNPTDFVPPGVDEMLINNGGSYLDPIFTRGRRGGDGEDDRVEEVAFDNCTAATGALCYSTAVIGNASLAWIRRAAAAEGPFFALISVKAPHVLDFRDVKRLKKDIERSNLTSQDIQRLQGNPPSRRRRQLHGYNPFPSWLQVHPFFSMAVPAPWYQDAVLPERRAPRTPNYNVTSPGHHWLVRTQPPLTARQARMVDELHASRLRSLLSVDDLVADLVAELDALGVLEDTYIVFTSDNGFRLGQFRIPMDKLHPYENDVRVPMMIRGPGIGAGGAAVAGGAGRPRPSGGKGGPPPPPPGAVFSHVHLMPTLLGLATGSRHGQDALPAGMDGTNLAGWLLEDDVATPDDGRAARRRNASRPGDDGLPEARSLLIEYNSQRNVARFGHQIDSYNHSFLALRIMPGRAPSRPGAADGGEAAATARGAGLTNLKYIEFRDSREDWTHSGPPLERELYDLDRDPYELTNLLAEGSDAVVAPALLRALESKTRRLKFCAGASCRREHATGLDIK